MNDAPTCVAGDVVLGRDVQLAPFVNLYGCQIGDETKIGAFVEIQKNATVGARCKISSHTFVCEGVTIDDECFVGHGVMFINDKYPRATNSDGSLQTHEDWRVVPTRVGRAASIGSGAVILCGITIGPGATIGAGAVVTCDVGARETVAGVPARVLGPYRFGSESLVVNGTETNPYGEMRRGIAQALPQPPITNH